MKVRLSYPIQRLTTMGLGVLLLASALAAAATGAQLISDIVVTTVFDEVNGNVSNVADLVANPGPDGISLREAILATNNNPGTYTIRFAPALKGATIAVSSQLPPLTGGSVAIEGDIDGDGKPDVTIEKAANFAGGGNCPSSDGCGFSIASSGNHLHAITLDGFGVGIDIDPQPTSDSELATHQTLSDNIVDSMVLSHMQQLGVVMSSMYKKGCGLYGGSPDPCWTYDTWANTTIKGNTIQALETGIAILDSTAGDRVENTTVTDNIIQMNGHDAGIAFVTLGNATETTISGGLIARNTITGRSDEGINLAAAGNRAQKTAVENVQVLDNQVNLISHDSEFCCQGMIVQAGSDAPWAILPNVLPLAYPDGNETKNILIRGNTVTGTLVWGIAVAAGVGAGGSSNSVHDIQIRSNSISSDTSANAVFIWTGGGGPPIENRPATGNGIANVILDSNRISVGSATGTQPSGTGAIRIVGGGDFALNGSVKNIQVINNLIASGEGLIQLIGGTKDSKGGNQLAGVQLVSNTIAGLGGPSLQITSNEDGSKGNTISGVTISNTIFTGSITGEVTAPMIHSSIIAQSNFAGVNGNIQADPKFIDPSLGDFHLQASSPAIDAGTSIGAPSTDLDGRARPDGHIDIGAYEFAGAVRPTPVALTPTPSPSTLKPPPSPTASKVVSTKIITCLKGKLTIRIKALRPKCPEGYKQK